MSAKNPDWSFRLKQFALLNLSASVIAFIFNLSSYGFRTFNLPEFVSSFIYSNCIGTLGCLVIFYISPNWKANPLLIRLAKVFVSLTFATFVGVVLARLFLSFIYPEFTKYGLLPGWQNFVFSLGIALTFGFGGYFFEFSQAKLRQKELDEERAKTLATEAQLASLESRIHPHFLFNTLNSIASLIREEPILAEKMVEKLSALLRYSLDSDAKGLVSLKQELEISEKYLEIEKVRFDKRLEYKIECDPQFLGTKIPPLSLQTLVENSIKHVASRTSEKTKISVLVSKIGDSVEIKVCDNGKGFSAKNLKENHGLDNLQKRLQTIFGEGGDLQIAENGSSCIALILPKT